MVQHKVTKVRLPCRLRLEVEFRNLGLRLRGRKGARVLAGVTGGMRAARLTAIMGPSGAGTVCILAR